MPEPLIALGLAFLFSGAVYLLFRPERGLVPQWRRTRQMGERTQLEDALKHLHHCEIEGTLPTLQSLAGALQISVDDTAELLSNLEADELIELKGSEIRLTSTGRRSALHILRAHRLWESYLADETGYPEVEWHDQADYYEHVLTEDEVDDLYARLGRPERDPHGDPIPTARGELVQHGGIPLTAADMNVPLRVVHLEDEPDVVYAQLVAEGLHPGMELRLIEVAPHRIRFWAGADEHVLAPVVASNIAVQPIPIPVKEPREAKNLSQLQPGEEAKVLRISAALRGAERRRLFDLGILPGTEVKAEFVSPGGDPTAYLVRGANIALRSEQAKFIEIEG
jgi:DtxR family Mn-dependent transcriptional regulator